MPNQTPSPAKLSRYVYRGPILARTFVLEKAEGKEPVTLDVHAIDGQVVELPEDDPNVPVLLERGNLKPVPIDPAPSKPAAKPPAPPAKPETEKGASN